MHRWQSVVASLVVVVLSVGAIAFLLEWQDQVEERDVLEAAPQPTAWQVLVEEPEFSEITNLIAQAGLQSVFENSEESFTFFAPSNTAFLNFTEEERLALTSDIAGLQLVLEQHLVDELIFSNDLNSLTEFISLGGTTFSVQASDDGSPARVGGQIVSQADILVSNGVLHRVGGLLQVEEN